MIGLIHSVSHAFMITGFVFVMMLVIEYLNVLSKGRWQKRLAGHGWGQYVLAAALGATPGCLGAFAVVTMYSHRVVTVGAVVAAMIATSGDEAFVMFAMIPKQALLLTAMLFVLGAGGGALTDLVLGRRKTGRIWCREGLEIHAEDSCECFPRGQIVRQWRECIPARGILAVALVVFVLALATGQIGPSGWTWIRVTLLATSCVALFVVSTVPDHFLEDHLWRHVVLKHAPRVFLWTLGALVVMEVVIVHLDLAGTVGKNSGIVFLISCIVGLIPESGPHLVFVALYARGAVPFSILLANSIVQDGHGMLPMLAHSKRAFFGIKLVNLIVGLVVGGLGLLLSGG